MSEQRGPPGPSPSTASRRGHARLDRRLMPRVDRALTMLAELAPSTLLDVGTGRGAFLWTLLDAFPDLEVTAIDRDEQRATELRAAAGDVARLSVERMDAIALRFEDDSFDGATLLEVLEHMPNPSLAAREAVRVSRRFVVVSVPSIRDDNPEHLHLFDRSSLTFLLEDAGAHHVVVEQVPGHLVAKGRVDGAP